jgi:hypothetical protein
MTKEVIHMLIITILFVLVVTAGAICGFIEFLKDCYKEHQDFKKIDEKYHI